MKILITGATGFVGSHLVEAIHEYGWEVHVAVRKSSNILDIQGYVNRFVYVNQADFEEVSALLSTECYDYIIHAAALTKAKTSEELHAVNVGNTENILKAAFSLSQPPKRIVFVSSLAAIGPISYDADTGISEDNDYNPVTAYGRSKRDAELMIKKKFANLPISVFRPTAVYGPREKDLFILFETLNKGLDPYIGRLPQKLSFVYVKDLVHVLILGCTVEQNSLQFYNISDGQIYSRFAMAEIFKKTFSRRPFRLYIPSSIVVIIAQISELLYRRSKNTPTIYPERLGELTAANWSCNIDKASKFLGYSPIFDLNRGLTESLIWYKEHNWLK